MHRCISASSRTYSTETGDDTAWAPFVGGTLSSTTASPSVRVPGEHPVIAWPESGGTRMAGSKPAADHHLVRNNVLLVWKELEEARNNLAEIEALAYDLPRPRTAPLPLGEYSIGPGESSLRCVRRVRDLRKTFIRHHTTKYFWEQYSNLPH